MTCIVGVRHGGRVWIGGDSVGGGWNYSVSMRADPKVFRVEKDPRFLVGFTDSFRMGQLLRFKLDPGVPTGLSPDDAEAAYRFMVQTFVDSARTCLSEGGYTRKEHERERGGTFIVGFAGQLYEVHSDFQVASPADGYVACGCGEQLALGSLHSTRHLKSQTQRVEKALEAAEYHSGMVRRPWTILEGQRR